jgi:hypothetical protein
MAWLEGSVSSADHYRHQSEHCRKQAGRSKDRDQKTIWLQLANAWRSLADHIAASNDKKS